ncbi:MAG TPA: hypothetical protein VMU75_11030 [Acidimicrobiales bacterium]|nr:hypothetical protein [Acidimicrobiales bacterium]
MGVMRVLDHTGDTAVLFDARDEATLDAARGLFDQLASEGKLAFARRLGEREGVRIRDFDPDAEEIIWVRPVQGG